MAIKTGRDIAAERTRCGVTQAELAERLGVSKVLLSFVEAQPDVVSPTREFAARVEQALAEKAA